MVTLPELVQLLFPPGVTQERALSTPLIRTENVVATGVVAPPSSEVIVAVNAEAVPGTSTR